MNCGETNYSGNEVSKWKSRFIVLLICDILLLKCTWEKMHLRAIGQVGPLSDSHLLSGWLHTLEAFVGSVKAEW